MPTPYRPGRLRSDFDTYSRSRRRRRIGSRVLVGVLSVAVLAGGGAYAMYDYTVGAITTQNVKKLLPDETARAAKPADAGKSVNILIMGVDNRQGENAQYNAGATGQTENLSDTTIIAHMSADGKSAVFVSIPRDTLVDIPACKKDDNGKTVETKPRPHTQINEAVQIGGPVCTWTTIESVATSLGVPLRIDHYVTIDFSGVAKMSNAIGGVPVCLTKPIKDKVTGLNLPAGNSNLKGSVALQFVRARHNIGDGSDLGRIKRQQYFMSSMLRKALTKMNIFDLPTLLGFAHQLGQSLVTDSGLNPVDFVMKYKNLDVNNIVFLTIPSHAIPKGQPNYGRVLLDPAGAKAVLNAIAHDQPLPGQNLGNSSLVVPPSDVNVEVLNGTTTNGLASKTSEDLKGFGFGVPKVGNAATTGVAQTTIYYDASHTSSAQTLKAFIKGPVQVQEKDGLSTGVQLVIGADWAGAQRPSTATGPATGTTDVATTNAGDAACLAP